MPLLRISPATQEDIPQLEALVNSAYRGETSRRGWTTEADLLEGIRIDQPVLQEMLNRKNAILLRCTNEQGNLVGCVFLQKQQARLYLGMLTVQPQLQGTGIGKQLLRASEAYAREQGCRSIVMTVISIRSELIAWYERHGFRLTGATEPFPDDSRFGRPKQPLEFVVLKKVLSY